MGQLRLPLFLTLPVWGFLHVAIDLPRQCFCLAYYAGCVAETFFLPTIFNRKYPWDLLSEPSSAEDPWGDVVFTCAYIFLVLTSTLSTFVCFWLFIRRHCLGLDRGSDNYHAARQRSTHIYTFLRCSHKSGGDARARLSKRCVDVAVASRDASSPSLGLDPQF